MDAINTGMESVIVSKKNSVYLKVDCGSKAVSQELCDFFTFKVPGFQFMPAYRSRMWDGKIRLYNQHSQELYCGLLEYLKSFCSERGYWIGVPKELHDPVDQWTKEDVAQFIEHLKPVAGGKQITAHTHQIDAIQHALNKQRCLLLSPTGSGKSLIIYALMRRRLEEDDRKVLIVVPTTSLVAQMENDFTEYSSADKSWNAGKHLHKIFAGQSKTTEKRVVITTWQSIYKQPLKWFQQFGSVFGDECHLYKAKSLTSIMSKMVDCQFRVGTTGTLDGTQTHKLIIEGLFGAVYKVTSTTELIQQKLLSDFTIDCITLKYCDEDCKTVKTMKYQEEIDFLVSHTKRNKFLTNLSCKLKGNTLVLFQYVEKHGKPLFEQILQEGKSQGKDVFFVYGGTDVDQREQVRQIAETKDNAIIVASYGTFSTGVSIRRLHNIVFASPSKSRIRVLQSIGRQLRKSEHKEKAKLYDIADDLRWKSKVNFTLNHFLERIRIYSTEKFEFTTIAIKL
jgi:superfamily II DNA or RNA helicase